MSTYFVSCQLTFPRVISGRDVEDKIYVQSNVLGYGQLIIDMIESLRYRCSLYLGTHRDFKSLKLRCKRCHHRD